MTLPSPIDRLVNKTDYGAYAVGYLDGVAERAGESERTLVTDAEIRAAYGRWLIRQATQDARRLVDKNETPTAVATRLSPGQRRVLAVLADGQEHATGPATSHGFVQGNAAHGLVRLKCARVTRHSPAKAMITSFGSQVWQEIGPEERRRG